MRHGILAVGLALFAACGGGSTTKGDGGASGSCAPGSLVAKVYGSPVTSTCYTASTVGGTGFALVFAPTQSSSVWGTDGDGLYVYFSDASGCSYAAGKVLQLSDPCIQISDLAQAGDGALPGNTDADGGTACAATSSCKNVFQGFVNSCTSYLEASSPAPACGAASQAGTAPTDGTLTINQWSTASGGTVSFTLSGNITGFFGTVGNTTWQAAAVPVSGTAQATVQ